MTTTETATANTKRPRKMARKPKAEELDQHSPADAAPTKRESKADLVLRMLRMPEGASVEQLSEMTGWLPHTARAALTGLKKKGHAVTSEKPDGGFRIYRVVEA